MKPISADKSSFCMFCMFLLLSVSCRWIVVSDFPVCSPCLCVFSDFVIKSWNYDAKHRKNIFCCSSLMVHCNVAHQSGEILKFISEKIQNVLWRDSVDCTVAWSSIVCYKPWLFLLSWLLPVLAITRALDGVLITFPLTNCSYDPCWKSPHEP